MSPGVGPESSPPPRRRRGALWAILVVVLVAAALLALAFVPYGSASQEIQVAPGSSATTSISIPHAGWVTVHFDHAYGMGGAMHYWMQGPSGMMFDHSMMGAGSDSFAFWSWGGAYECGAGSAGSAAGPTPVWVNSTWGML